uniref:Uncharacterized protein n=1 Tax=Arundo donax TaxID=35708 RepID=A0A0A9E521_ARUDO
MRVRADPTANVNKRQSMQSYSAEQTRNTIMISLLNNMNKLSQ